ncbi:MAG: DUF1579 domain-containing protein [bacterium]|nr:DUF1579 domain-containing protein [bacterium]
MRKPLLMALAAGCLAAALATAVPAAAQDGQTDQKAMEEMMMKLAAPGAPHQHLATLAGNWMATTTMYMDGATPTTSTGKVTYEVVLGGRYVLGRYQMSFMGQPMEGLSVDGYDNMKQEYFSLWFDTMGTGFYEARGKASADGKTVALAGTMEMGPMQIPSRSETVFVDKDTVRFTMWQSMGGQEMKAMEMEYKRAK